MLPGFLPPARPCEAENLPVGGDEPGSSRPRDRTEVDAFGIETPPRSSRSCDLDDLLAVDGRGGSLQREADGLGAREGPSGLAWVPPRVERSVVVGTREGATRDAARSSARVRSAGSSMPTLRRMSRSLRL